MDSKAMYKLTYGLFVLTARQGDKDNGCIINTAGQVTSEPNRISFTVNKDNYTHDMILNDRKFNLSVLSESAQFELYKHFGFNSGKNTDKFADFSDCKRALNGLYYITRGANAYISGYVQRSIDLDTHTLFIADVTNMEVLSDEPSVTYTYYQQKVKPQPQSAVQTNDVIWRCVVCGWEYNETKGDPENGIAPGTKFEDLPDDYICPICKHPKSDFERIETKVKEENSVKKYECGPCGWVYDPEVGDPDGGIAPGTAFEDIPEDWVCPICGASKADFQEI